jgi:hypothetical protein
MVFHALTTGRPSCSATHRLDLPVVEGSDPAFPLWVDVGGVEEARAAGQVVEEGLDR